VIALVAAALIATVPAWRAWRFDLPLNVGAARESYVRVRLPLSVDGGSAGTYPDLRIVDDRAMEVPYALDAAPPSLVDAERVGPQRIVALRMKAASQPYENPNEQTWTFDGGGTYLGVAADEDWHAATLDVPFGVAAAPKRSRGPSISGSLVFTGVLLGCCLVLGALTLRALRG
jgi:hypothetical protein